MWAELEAVREFGTTPMWRLSIYGLDASEPQVSVSIPVPDHAALLRWQVSRDGVFDTSLPLDLWQTGALSGTVNPTGRGRLDILLQAKLDPKQVALGTVIELEATVGSWTDSWPVEYQADPFTRDEKLWPKNDHRAVEEFLHVDKQGGELLADLVARGWTLADLLRSVIDVQDRILAAGIMAVQGPQGEQGDTGADGADGVVDYDEAWDRANHTGTQSADTLTDGTTKKAFLATERTDLSSAVTKLGSVDNTGALFRIVNATGTGSIPLVVKGIVSQTGNLQQWQDSTGTALSFVSTSGAVYTPAVGDTSISGPYLSMTSTGVIIINRTLTGNTPLTVKGMASQTGNLTAWRDSADVLKAYVNSGGSFYGTVYGDLAQTGPYWSMGPANAVLVNRDANAASVAIIIRGAVSQAGSLTQWQDSNYNVVASVTASGNFYGAAVGDKNASGPYLALNANGMVATNRTTASNVPLIVKGMAAQTGNLTEWQDSAGTMMARVASSGYISSIAGMATPTVAENTSTGPYLSLAANWMGVINRSTTSNVVFIVKGMASQTGNLQEWQNSAGTALAWVSSTGAIATNGGLVAATLGSASSGYPYLSLGNNSITVLNRTTASNVPLIVRGMAAQTGNLTEWQDSAGVVKAFVSSVGGIAATGGFIGPYLVNATNTETYLALTGGSVLLQNRNTVTNKPLIVQGMASQTGNLTEWQDSAGTVLASVSSTGMWSGPRPMELMVSVTDETTALTTGTAKLTFRIPRACAVTSVRANLNTVSSSGNPAFDVNKNGTSIFSTTLTIDASEKTSVTAATAAVLTSNPITFADDDEVTIDIDTAGTGAKGAKLTFLGYYT